MTASSNSTLIITNIGQLVTMQGAFPRIGAGMRDLGIINGAAIAFGGERILAVGGSSEIEKQFAGNSVSVIDAQGSLATPGFIDPHTHPVFSATREDELEMRLQGKSYMEIAQAGGGIRRSVRDLRATPTDTLISKAKSRLDRFLQHGVTTIEAKSGYGLSTESEIKQLEVIKELNESHPVDLVPTFLGAHEFPDEYRDNRQAYVDLVINEMLPEVAKRKLAVFSDIFCEEGVFDIIQSRKIQEAAVKHGLKLKFHADELASTGGAELAASMGAISADHLVFISDTGIAAMAKARTVAVLLPGTSYSLGSKKYAPARAMIEAGVVVALSTDCNPGSNNSESLAMMLSLAAVQMKMTAAEGISAVTVNAAYAIGRDDIGVIAPGKIADVVIWDAADVRELPYHYGVNLARTVVKRGKVAVVHA